jgi:hypothetical protein
VRVGRQINLKSDPALLRNTFANVRKDVIRISFRGDDYQFVLVLFHDWFAMIVKRDKTLFDGFHVVISSTTGPSPVQETCCHCVISHIEADQKRALPHVLFKLNSLFDLCTRPVNRLPLLER